MPNKRTKKPGLHKIALTGGPGGGKSTAAELFRREFKDHISLVPEVATLLFKGGFPRVNNESVVASIQKSIFQMSLVNNQEFCSEYPKESANQIQPIQPDFEAYPNVYSDLLTQKADLTMR
jgi:ADP-ribose pyrophosphatase YjhB (NUDIX family)